ncbi:MAG TPA: HAD family hydrolase [Flavisolibacter sp.]|nr:HAD family hydrolase [Flavisolibacter sp.]
MKKGIAFFDFDGTITTKDTLLEFIKFSKGSFLFYLGFLINSPYLVAMKLGLISNQVAKEKVLRFFFKNKDINEFNELCNKFALEEIPNLIRLKAKQEIKKLKTDGFVIVVVSASPENWIQKWSFSEGLELIASKLEVNNGKITGKILGKNCHGVEKLKRIKEKYIIEDYKVIYAYGDTSGDRPMLNVATHSFYKPFRG